MSFMKEHKSVRCRRDAMTLIELLTILGIVTLLAALILPSVKNLMVSRKSSQAAIVVRNFIESARARAIGKNRSVAVVLERVSSRAKDMDFNGRINDLDRNAQGKFDSGTSSMFDSTVRTSVAPDTNFIPYNACIQLSLAEEPLPINETMIPFRTGIAARLPGGSLAIPTSVYTGVNELIDPDQNNGIPEARIFSVSPLDAVTGVETTGIDPASWLGEYLVAGNEISFGNSPTRFTIAAPRSRAPHDAMGPDGSGVTRIWFSVYNERGLDGIGERAMQPYIDLPADVMTSSFKIFIKPRPIYSQSIQLPKGTCIDLSLSGFANDHATLKDYRVRFASDWVISGTAGAPTPDELRPIYLVFSPDGSFSRVFANERLGSNSVRIDAVDDVFLHIGKIDQIVMPVDPAVKGRNRAAFDVANANGVKQNLTDLNSYIIRISPKSGAITSAPVVALDTQILVRGLDPTLLSLGDLIQLSRQGAYGFTATAQ